MTKQLAAILMVVLGGLLLIVSLAVVHYFSFISKTLWDVETAGPLSSTLIAAVAIVLVLLSNPFRSIWLPLVAVCCSLYLLGHAMPFLDSYRATGAGYWLSLAGALIMSLGSLLVTAERLSSKSTG